MIHFPPFRLDAADQSLWRDGRRVPLTPKAFAVLQYLAERAGRLVTQEELLAALWPDTFVQPEVLKSQILDVRTALGDRAKEPSFIETVPRRGYRFIAAVQAASPSAPVRTDTRKLVGRDRTLQHLRNCLERASERERQVIFVTGEPGMGKTSIVDAFLQELPGATPSARGQCIEGYAGVKEPYYPVLEAFGTLSRGPYAESLATVLETQAPTWLMQLPALLKPHHRETLRQELAGATRERMIREILEALETLTQDRTLVLLFEDLHWADYSTVDLISAIARRRAPARLMLLGTYRPVDIVLSQHPLKQVSQALKASRLCTEIALPSLSETDIADYLGGEGTPAASPLVQPLARWMEKQTEGNPLFMVTVVEHLQQLGHLSLDAGAWTLRTPVDRIDFSVPDTLRQMIDLQMETLSPREQLALGAASVHGMTFSAGILAAVLELDADGVEDTCQKLAQNKHIIRESGVELSAGGSVSQQYEFVHALFRGALYQSLAPARRAKLHARFGKAIEEGLGINRAEAASELAGHFEQAGDWLKAVDYLRIAVQNAWGRYAYAEAVSIAEHALTVTDKIPAGQRTPWEMRFREILAVLAHAAYEPAKALEALEALAARAAERGAPEVEGRALVYQMVVQASRDSRACIPMLARLRTLSSEHKGPLAICTFGWNAQLAQEHAESLAEVRRTGDRLSIASQQLDHAYVEWLSSRHAQSVRHARETLPIVLEGGQLVRYLLGRDMLAANLLLSGDWGGALDIAEESIRNARKNAAPHRLAMPVLMKAWVHLAAGDYQTSLDICAEVLPDLADPFSRDRRYFGLRISAAAEFRLGRIDGAIEKFVALRESMNEHPATLSWYWSLPLGLDLVDACLESGDAELARRESDATLKLALAAEERTWQALAWETSARVALSVDDRARAASDLANAFAAMDGFDVPLGAWAVHRTAARLARLQDDPAWLTHRDRAREVVLLLAKSLDTRAELQQTFRSSPAIAALFAAENEAESAAK